MRASWTPEGFASFVALRCAEPGPGAVLPSVSAYPALLRQYVSNVNRLEKEVSEYMGAFPGNLPELGGHSISGGHVS